MNDHHQLPERQDTLRLPMPVERGGPPAVRTPAAPSRAGRILAIVGILLGTLVTGLLVANALLTRDAEQRAAGRVEEALGVPADVDLSGWPVGLKLLGSQPIDARISADDVPLPGSAAVLSLLVLELNDLSVPRAEGDPLSAGSVRFTAEFDAAAVQQLVGLIGRLPLTDIELRNGIARLRVAGFPVVDATAELSDGRVAFRPTAPFGSLLTVSLQVDELPLGFEATAVEIREDVLRLEGSAEDFTLDS